MTLQPENLVPRRLLPFLVLGLAACGSVRPFSVMTPGLERLGEEEAHLYADADAAMQALGPSTLGARVQNLIDTYEDELARAEEAQGGALNTTLAVVGIVLPIGGTVSAAALSDPDHVQAVSIATGAATVLTLGLDLLLKPGAKAAAAAECSGFLASALEAIRLQWNESELTSLEGTSDQWARYMSMRGTLEPGRRAACEG